MPQGFSRDGQASDRKEITWHGDFTHVVAIGGSAGSLEALSDLIPQLPASLNAPVLIAVHTRSNGDFASFIRRMSVMPVNMAQDNDLLERGRIYIIPPMSHPTFTDGRIQLKNRGESGLFRPSIDMMFVGLAETYGRAVVGVVLSGALDDGTLGARTLQLVEARMIVQNPQEARFSSMPQHVIAQNYPKTILCAHEIAARIVAFVGIREDAA